ncbi:hypothetical protein DXG03_004620 [Asterophora parasitica]|uniref:Mis12 domain-containing protein n=1 Tax=Asterophora parasitica TaxID=117018 RepID=A0A9P7KCX8_9AGAR|nr:hypothetical protein DXG03_004620 [Asterophora parasitica]
MAADGEGPAKPAAPLLLPEILGFSPQLLLDDIINIANNAVQDGVNGMEEFLEKWAEARTERQGGEWDSTQEVEQGLVAFQTLLEHHTDIAFDFFEAWSLRNIFAIPPDLPIVVPHQQNLDLTHTPEREQELMDDLEELRKKLDNQRRLKRMLTHAIHVSERQRRREEEQLERLAVLNSPSLDLLGALPRKFMAMYSAVAALPPLDASTLASLSHADPGKRQWETSTTGYKNWAVAQLLSKAESGDAGGRSVVDTLLERAGQVGSAEQLRTVVEAVDDVRMGLDTVDSSRMEE